MTKIKNPKLRNAVKSLEKAVFTEFIPLERLPCYSSRLFKDYLQILDTRGVTLPTIEEAVAFRLDADNLEDYTSAQLTRTIAVYHYDPVVQMKKFHPEKPGVHWFPNWTIAFEEISTDQELNKSFPFSEKPKKRGYKDMNRLCWTFVSQDEQIRQFLKNAYKNGRVFELGNFNSCVSSISIARGRGNYLKNIPESGLDTRLGIKSYSLLTALLGKELGKICISDRSSYLDEDWKKLTLNWATPNNISGTKGEEVLVCPIYLHRVGRSHDGGISFSGLKLFDHLSNEGQIRGVKYE